MADGVTTNYEFILPEVGASVATWGNKNNDNWQALDAILATLRTTDSVVPVNKGGTGATDVAGALAALGLTNASPVGIIVDYAGATVPTGWLLCHGQAVSRTTYADLFAAIGTTYGSGNGSTTFNLPDCRGRVRSGKDDMGGTDAERLSAFFGAAARTLAGVLGAASHILTTGQMPSHNHTYSGNTSSNGSHAHNVTASGTTSTNGAHQHQMAFNNTGAVSTIPIASGGGVVQATQNTSSAGDHVHTVTVTGSTDASANHVHSYSGTTSTVGNNEAHANAQPTIVFNTIIKAL